MEHAITIGDFVFTLLVIVGAIGIIAVFVAILAFIAKGFEH